MMGCPGISSVSKIGVRLESSKIILTTARCRKKFGQLSTGDLDQIFGQGLGQARRRATWSITGRLLTKKYNGHFSSLRSARSSIRPNSASTGPATVSPGLPLLVDSTDVFVLHNVHPSLVNSNIRFFLKHELSELGRRCRMKRGGRATNTSTCYVTERSDCLFMPLQL